MLGPNGSTRASDDIGFVCKACGRFYADQDVKWWDTKWSEADNEGERTLLEIIHKCPLCGEIRTYVPSESTFRGLHAPTSYNEAK